MDYIQNIITMEYLHYPKDSTKLIDSILEEEKAYSLAQALLNPTKVRMLMLNGEELKQLNKDFSVFPNLQILLINEADVSVMRNYNQDFPKDMSDLDNLLKISFFTQVKSIPHSLITLPNLRFLMVNYLGVDDLEEEVSKIKNLKSLEFLEVLNVMSEYYDEYDEVVKRFIHEFGHLMEQVDTIPPEEYIDAPDIPFVMLDGWVVIPPTTTNEYSDSEDKGE